LGVLPAPASAAVGDVRVQVVTLGPGGSAVISGTIECATGSDAFGTVELRQKGHGGYNLATGFFGSQGSLPCSANGPVTWTVGPAFGSRPFHPGPAVVQVSSGVCTPTIPQVCAFGSETKEVKITRS
jgi:hypothetical protein